MGLREEGYGVMKFFPAEQAGGGRLSEVALIAARRHPVLPDRRHFACQCARLLTLPNVVCVGGLPGCAEGPGRQGRLGRHHQKLAAEAFALRADPSRHLMRGPAVVRPFHSSRRFVFPRQRPMSQSANDGAGWGVHARHRAWTEKGASLMVRAKKLLDQFLGSQVPGAGGLSAGRRIR